MAEVDYTINYDDERFQNVETDKTNAMNDVDSTYDSMIDSTDSFYQGLIDATNKWGDTQTQLQQEMTDFTIEKIEQDKERANKDYIKEQSGAYADWQKESNKYGVQAEQKAAAGLYGTGYSESSQVAMYNTYQNRVATARETYQQAILNYDNSIKEARLQNNSILAQIAYNTLQTTLQLGLEGFQYQNQLITDKLNTKIELDQTYWNRTQDVLNQINTENALAENVRQFGLNYQLSVDELNEKIRQYNQDYQLRVDELNEKIRQFDEEMAELKKQNSFDNQYKLQQLQIQKENLQLEKDKLDEDKRQFNKTVELQKSSSTKSSGKAVKGKTPAVVDGDNGDGNYEVNTEYYQGNLNADARIFGAFSNGYQPKGITGYGRLSDSGSTITIETQTLNGQKRTVTQTLWKTSDGSLWYWEGRKNKYILVKKAQTGGSNSGGGGGTKWVKAVK